MLGGDKLLLEYSSDEDDDGDEQHSVEDRWSALNPISLRSYEDSNKGVTAVS